MQRTPRAWALAALLAVLSPSALGASPDEARESRRIAGLVARLNGDSRDESLEARRQLLRLPIAKLLPQAAALLARVKPVGAERDDAAFVLQSLGPDCGAAVPAFEKAVSAEGDPRRVEELLELLCNLGTAARPAVPLLQRLKTRTFDARLSRAAARAEQFIDVPEARARATLAALRTRAVGNTEQLVEVTDALKLVLERRGLSTAHVREVTVLVLASQGYKHLPFSRSGDDLFRLFPSALRIAAPVVIEAAEGDDENRRSAAFTILALSAGTMHGGSWPATAILERLLTSRNAAARRLAAETMARARRAQSRSWDPGGALARGFPALRRAYLAEKDGDTLKAMRRAIEVFEKKP